MTRLLIVEDQPSDLQIAADIARSLNVTEIEGRVSATTAKLYLDGIIDGNQARPDVIILDLDLGYESGHELLRFWHSHPTLSSIPLVVWTALGKEQQELCQLFNVNAVVAKWEGAAALKRVLEPFTNSGI